MKTSHEKSRQPRSVREQILNTAINLLAEDGVQNLSQVQVAKNAGIRQSHLTYYFPTREDLLSAITERAIDAITSAMECVITENKKGERQLLKQLAASIAETAHMRLFIAMIVEADRDPTVREIVKLGTLRMESSLAEKLGGDRAAAKARNLLAAVWGLGLYHFVMRADEEDRLTHEYLSWIADRSREPGGAR